MGERIVLVILNYNNYYQVEELLNKLFRFERISNIVVVDNHSTDSSVELLREYVEQNEKVCLVCCDENLGYAAGNNMGIRYAEEHFSPEYLIISNPDVYFDEEVVSEAISVLNSTDENLCEKVGLVAPQMVSAASFRTSYAWRLPNKGDMFLYNFMALRKLLRRMEYPKDYFMKKYSAVEVLPGSLFFCKTDTMRKVNYFDEETFLYWEENILSYKLRNNGYTNILMNHVSYEHMHGTTIDKEAGSLKRKLELNYAGQMVYAKKYLRMNSLELGLLNLAFKLGTFNYLSFKKIFAITSHH